MELRHSSRAAAAAAGSTGLRYRECNSLSIRYSDLVFGIHTSAPIQICEFQVQNLNMQLHSFFKGCGGRRGVDFFSLPFAFLHCQCWKLFDSAQLLFSGLRQHVENAKSQMGFITGSRVSF